MKYYGWFFLAAAGWAFSSCGGNVAKDAEGFPPEETLAADSVAIAEVLQPERIGVYNGYAVIASPKTGKVVFRYKLPQWTFADSSLVKGEGPNDMQTVAMLDGDPAGDVVWMSEPMKGKIVKFSVSPQGLSKVGEVSVGGKNNPWISGGAVSGNRLVYERLNFDTGESTVYLADMGDSLVKRDSMRAFSKSEIKETSIPGGIGKMAWIRNYASVRMAGDRLAVWYGDTETLMSYRVGADGKPVHEKTLGDTLTYEKVAGMDFEQLKKDYSRQFLAATDKYLYLGRTQFDRIPDEKPSPDNPLKRIGYQVTVYDWDMNPVKKFSLDRPAAGRVLVDEANGKFYAYDPSLDFEQVYVYDYTL